VPATIVWSNETGVNAVDLSVFGSNEAIARQLIHRAIDDWEAVIADFNYDGDDNDETNNTFNFTVGTYTIGPRGLEGPDTFISGSPTTGHVNLNINAGGAGWFFDATPTDDAEFIGLASAFSASFVDVNGQTKRDDFYRTVLHELGHALGLTNAEGTALREMLTPLVDAEQQPILDPTGILHLTPLHRFQSTRANPQFGVVATFIIGHLYEGDIYGVNNDPTTVYAEGSSVPLAFVSHPNDLMNDGRTVPAGNPDPDPPNETVRQFISDLDAKILADAYGYSVVLPSTLNTAHTTLDSDTGTLLIQGGLTVSGGSQNDTISVDIVGPNIRVQVNGTTELVPQANVTQIIIAGNGGTDDIDVDPALESLRKTVDYIVSSNQDVLDDGDMPGDSIVDIRDVIPGRQVSLRAAIVDANGTSAGSARSIYVPRGKYNLTISGTGGDTQGDLDINRKLTIIGTGAGATVVDASTLATRDRLFEIVGGTTASLDLSRMTLTGGETAANGGAISVGNNTSAFLTELKLTETVIVGNSSTTSFGGGVYVQSGAGFSDVRSVITGNTSTASDGGAGIYLVGSTSTLNAGSAVLDRSIVANNTAPLGPDLRSAAPTGSGTMAGVFTSVGGNLITSTAGSNFATSGLHASDHVGAVDYVVTSIVDSFNDADNAWALSVREAVNQSNSVADLQSIWLPAWNFVLTRDRAAFGGGSLTDVNTAFGDLDITQSLNIRGSEAVGATSVTWRPGVSDAVFDLIGDFDGDGITTFDDGYITGNDYLIWQQTLGSTTDLGADANDNGIVDGDDDDLFWSARGNQLTLVNV
jgi:hypothetical protein